VRGALGGGARHFIGVGGCWGAATGGNSRSNGLNAIDGWGGVKRG
jgi:hypothetical protein